MQLLTPTILTIIELRRRLDDQGWRTSEVSIHNNKIIIYRSTCLILYNMLLQKSLIQMDLPKILLSTCCSGMDNPGGALGEWMFPNRTNVPRDGPSNY